MVDMLNLEMPRKEMTKSTFAAYLYLMQNVFPSDANGKRILVIKDLLVKFYFSEYNGKRKHPRKNIDRNWDALKGIRNGSLKVRYFPSKETLRFFVAYVLQDPKGEITFEEYSERYKEDIHAYFEDNAPSPKVVDLFIPRLPEKLVGIENRISKIEEFIESKDELIDRLLTNSSNSKNFNEIYGNQKIALDFLNYLQQQLFETKQQYKWAKLAYRNLGSFGLFFIPLKYALFDEQLIIDDFFNEGLFTGEDVFEDLT